MDQIAETIAAGAKPQSARKWWTGELARLANADGKDVADLEVSPAHIAELANLVESGKINDRIGRDVLLAVLAGEGPPAQIVSEKGLEVVSDDGALLAAIDEALATQPDVIDAIREGRMQAAGAVIGAVMKAMKGQADAARVRELLIQRASE
jgi:aspartyl-tRNA(Asn)/glutamyl-tRNA(Gln) amidotransferase subunit B